MSATQASPSVAYFSLVSLYFVRLPGGLCISSFPCKPFWRDCLSVVLSSMQHSGVSVPAMTLAVKNRVLLVCSSGWLSLEINSQTGILLR